MAYEVACIINAQSNILCHVLMNDASFGYSERNKDVILSQETLTLYSSLCKNPIEDEGVTALVRSVQDIQGFGEYNSHIQTLG